MHTFKHASGVFAYDLSDPAQCDAALTRIAPVVQAQRHDALQAIATWDEAARTENAWLKAKQEHDEWLASGGQAGAIPSHEPQRPGPRPPAPGDQPPAVPELTAADVLGNLTQEWEDVTGNWPPPPTAEEQAAAAQAERVAKYLRRAQSAPRLVAEFAAENEVRLATGQWTLVQLQAVINDPNVATLIRLLQSASYESALALVQSLSGGVYTAELKASWIAKIRGAM